MEVPSAECWNGLYAEVRPPFQTEEYLKHCFSETFPGVSAVFTLHAEAQILHRSGDEESMAIFLAEISEEDQARIEAEMSSEGRKWKWMEEKWFYEPRMPFNDRGMRQLISKEHPFMEMKLWLDHGRFVHWQFNGAGDPFPGWEGKREDASEEARRLGCPENPPEDRPASLTKNHPKSGEIVISEPLSSDVSIGGSGLLKTAMTYYDHRDRLIYSGEGKTFLRGGDIQDKEREHRGNIDCSTFVLLCMKGICFEDSPYTGKAEVREVTGNGEITSAADIAKFYWDAGRCFLNKETARPGDLVFFRSPYRHIPFARYFGRFLAVSHVGILGEKEGTFVEATGSQLKPQAGEIIPPAIRISNLKERKNLICFARPLA